MEGAVIQLRNPFTGEFDMAIIPVEVLIKDDKGFDEWFTTGITDGFIKKIPYTA